MSGSTADTIDIVARTAYGEARGCGVLGLTAVINVICNRAAHPTWWGDNLSSVCLEPYQFSCRNLNDPNRAKLLSVGESDPWFAIARGLATRAVYGTLADLTHGADSYFARSMQTPPAWAARATRLYVDSCHAFYRVETAAASSKPEACNVSTASTADQLNADELDDLENE